MQEGMGAPVPHLSRGVLAHVAVGYEHHVRVASLDGIEKGQVVGRVVGLAAILPVKATTASVVLKLVWHAGQHT